MRRKTLDVDANKKAILHEPVVPRHSSRTRRSLGLLVSDSLQALLRFINFVLGL
jgi:hypothetical protein